MNTTLLRYTLALFLCGITTAAMADNDDILISEDFTEFTISGTTWPKNGTGESGIWNLYYCEYKENAAQTNNAALKITCDNSSSPKYYGYASSPSLGYNGNVLLSFKCGKSTNTNATLILSILDDNNVTFYEGGKTKEIPITIKHADGGSYFVYNILGTTALTQLQFKTKTGNYFYIDNIAVTKDILSENINNSSFISVHKNNITNVKTSRTLKGGIWNTLCLPFNVTKATMVAALGENQDIQMRTYTSYDETDNSMIFNSVADDATVVAGTPFLIKINSDVINPTFESVTIVDTPAETVGENGSVQFVGTYDPINLNIDGTNLFITTSGSLAKPKDENSNHMKGLRAYITVPAGMNLARLTINDETTDIQQIALNKEKPTTLYILNGQRLQTLKKGIIIRDGKLTFIK